MTNSVISNISTVLKLNRVANEVLARAYPIAVIIVSDPNFINMDKRFKERKSLVYSDGSDRAYMSIIDNGDDMVFEYHLLGGRLIQTYFTEDGRITKTMVNGRIAKREVDINDVRSAKYILNYLSDLDLLVHRIDVEIPKYKNRSDLRRQYYWEIADIEYYKDTNEFCVRLNLSAVNIELLEVI